MNLQTGMSALCCLSFVLAFYESIVFIRGNKTCRKIGSKYVGKGINTKQELQTEIPKLKDNEAFKAKKEIKIRLIINLTILILAVVGIIVFGIVVSYA